MLLRKIAKAISLAMLFVFMLVTLTPATAVASVKGRKNTAIALGAVSIYSLMTGKPKTALLFGAGAAYAYKRYKDVKPRRYYRR